jgi:hydroxyacylglutathione hydrolase
MHSMAEHVVTLPGDTAVFPGHGPTTTIARELATNPFLEAFRR